MRPKPLLFLILGLIALTSTLRAGERTLFDAEWKFKRGDDSSASTKEFADPDWRTIDVPHDWSIEAHPAAEEPSAGGGGFYPTGVAWYRKTFNVPKTWQTQRTTIEFEGVSANSTVWINGQELGLHRYAYTPFSYDLTPHLIYGAANTIAVRVENEPQPNSRWYTGSGLYRHVWLRRTDPVYVMPESVFIQTLQAGFRAATLDVQATVHNGSSVDGNFTVEASLINDSDTVVGTCSLETPASAGGDAFFRHPLSIANPLLWSPASPNRYRAVIRVLAGKHEIERFETIIGVRVVSVSAEKGLLINGEAVKLFGGNLHHDNGVLGAAAYDRAEERKAELLKTAGFTAVRTSHNPPSRAFLEACDRLGLLVVDEAFDGWVKPKTPHGYSEHFAESWPADLDTMVLRDRNHPCVVLWSIGNEVFERGSTAGAKLAHDMVARIRALDTTRLVTAGINGMGKNGDWTKTDPLFAELGVAGYNYEMARHEADHARLPNRIILGTESYIADVWSTFSTIRSQPYLLGDFVWSAMDYLGEAGIGQVFLPDEKATPHWEGNHFPWHGAACGDIDLIGERKPFSHYRAIVWNRGESISMAVQEPTQDGRPWNVSAWAPPPLLASWTWPGFEKRPLEVEIYSREDAVRLYLNGRLLGEKPTGEANACKAVFTVPYEAGTLRAVEVKNKTETNATQLSTAGASAKLKLSSDRQELVADHEDLVFVTIEVVDARGIIQPNANPKITYELTGPGSLAAIGNADLTSVVSYHENTQPAYRGRALIVIRATGATGKITLTAKPEGLAPSSLAITAHTPSKRTHPAAFGSADP